MIAILWIILGCLLFKLIYNLTVPYQLLRRKDEKSGISPMILIEWTLLAIAIGFSAMSNTEYHLLQPLPLLGIGAGLILLSYLHFVLTMMIGGWIANRKQ